ncbi:hypothetical protein GCM10027034_28040 [Ramlibacter solisilvae]|uniref:Lipoprotein n=1 Tax=Ramlibacter tataouinensis TaxID=94132 RepID=A0A127JR49_9BURK|nr:hypothetical protein [Ramlibacter tataouinensis]AMO22447.1 hypothetical protein UC35_05445 [Ramlibacter tataouinensis]
MNRHMLAAIAAAATAILTAGCSTSSTSMGASPSSGPSDDGMCQVFRSYARDRGITPNLQEECARQLGVDGCRKCLSMQ